MSIHPFGSRCRNVLGVEGEGEGRSEEGVKKESAMDGNDVAEWGRRPTESVKEAGGGGLAGIWRDRAPNVAEKEGRRRRRSKSRKSKRGRI